MLMHYNFHILETPLSVPFFPHGLWFVIVAADDRFQDQATGMTSPAQEYWTVRVGEQFRFILHPDCFLLNPHTNPDQLK